MSIKHVIFAIFLIFKADMVMAIENCYEIEPLILSEDEWLRSEEIQVLGDDFKAFLKTPHSEFKEKYKGNLLANYYYLVWNFQCTNTEIFVQELTSLAEKGVAAAGITLGDLYLNGVNLVQSEQKAIASYSMSAELKSSTAYLRLGQLYASKARSPEDLETAKKYFRMSESAGDMRGSFNLGIMAVTKEDNIEKGISYFQKAANSGHDRAAYNLFALFSDENSPYFDKYKAMVNLKLAAEAGIVEAQYFLGTHYLTAEENKMSFEMALELLEKAANSEYVHAQEALASHYSKNIESLEEFEKAEKWMQKAALNGSKTSNNNLILLYDSFKEAIPDAEARKNAWIMKYNSANLGEQKVQYH